MITPLFFHPIYKERVWGGRKLADKYHRKLPGDRVGESWEIACHKNGMSIVKEGSFKGKKLQELINEYGQDILGKAVVLEYDKFPLLVKLLDAEDTLSVQVHPDDVYASLNEYGELGKTEMWYIIDAKPGAKLIYGVREGVHREDFRNGIYEGSLEKYLRELEVQKGDVLYIPSGLVHAVGSGILLYEIQQNSDATYRVYDWNRKDSDGKKRELHIDKAIDVIDFDNKNAGYSKMSGLVLQDQGGIRTLYAAGKYFAMEKLSVYSSMNLSMKSRRFQILTCIEGQGNMQYPGGRKKLKAGMSALIPASLSNLIVNGRCTIMRSWVPDRENMISCLLSKGFTKEELSKVAGLIE
ncbi:MAG: type I phosphomannose isomerase catalytic subunit [Caldicoprobacterales bacterium]|jgi:mannose-6-phosphate isomerase